MVKATRRIGVAACVAALGIAVFAMPGQAAKKSAAQTKVTIGVIPIAQFVALQLGVEKGFYGRQGIDLQLNKRISSGALVQVIASGAVEGSTLNYGTLSQAVSSGVPVVAINTITAGAIRPEDDDPQLLTREDSGIKSVADLKDKKVAVNNVGGSQEVTVRRAAQRAGISATSVKVVGVPFPQMGSLVRSKQVDAVLIGDPFATQLKEQVKMRLLSGSTSIWKKGQQFGSLLVSRKWWDANRALGRKLQFATRQSVDYAARHPEAVRAALPGFTGVAKEITDKQVLPRFYSKQDLKDIQNTARVMKAYNMIKELPDMRKHVILLPETPKKKAAPKKKASSKKR